MFQKGFFHHDLVGFFYSIVPLPLIHKLNPPACALQKSIRKSRLLSVHSISAHAIDLVSLDMTDTSFSNLHASSHQHKRHSTLCRCLRQLAARNRYTRTKYVHQAVQALLLAYWISSNHCGNRETTRNCVQASFRCFVGMKRHMRRSDFDKVKLSVF